MSGLGYTRGDGGSVNTLLEMLLRRFRHSTLTRPLPTALAAIVLRRIGRRCVYWTSAVQLVFDQLPSRVKCLGTCTAIKQLTPSPRAFPSPTP